MLLAFTNFKYLGNRGQKPKEHQSVSHWVVIYEMERSKRKEENIFHCYDPWQGKYKISSQELTKAISGVKELDAIMAVIGLFKNQQILKNQ